MHVSVFSPSAGKYGPEKTPYLDTFHAVDEREALHSLKYDDQIIIKPADKGSAVVVWSKDDYLLEASNKSSDTNVYQKYNSNPLKKVNNEVKSVLRDIFNPEEINTKVREEAFVPTCSAKRCS